MEQTIDIALRIMLVVGASVINAGIAYAYWIADEVIHPATCAGIALVCALIIYDAATAPSVSKG